MKMENNIREIVGNMKGANRNKKGGILGGCKCKNPKEYKVDVPVVAHLPLAWSSTFFTKLKTSQYIFVWNV